MVNVLIDNSTYLQNTIVDWEKNQIQSLKRQLSKELSEEKKQLEDSYLEFESTAVFKNEQKKQQIVQKYSSLIHMKKKAHELEQFSVLYNEVVNELQNVLSKKSKKTDAFFTKMAKQLIKQYGNGNVYVPKHVSVSGAKSTLDILAVTLVVKNTTYELTVAEMIEQSQETIRGVLRE